MPFSFCWFCYLSSFSTHFLKVLLIITGKFCIGIILILYLLSHSAIVLFQMTLLIITLQPTIACTSFPTVQQCLFTTCLPKHHYLAHSFNYLLLLTTVTTNCTMYITITLYVSIPNIQSIVVFYHWHLLSANSLLNIVYLFVCYGYKGV